MSKAALEHYNLGDLLQDRCISFSEVSLKCGCRVHEHNPQRGKRSREVSQSPELVLVPRVCDGSSGPENYEFLIQHMHQSRAIRFKDLFFLYMLHFSQVTLVDLNEMNRHFYQLI